MRLYQLLEDLSEFDIDQLDDLEITGIVTDSRQVFPGAIFVAVEGTRTDGHRFLGDAAGAGAAALVGEAADPGLGIPYWQVPDSRLALARLAAAWFGNPTRNLFMIGVTGTDGKTTTVHLLHHILLEAKFRTGVISTVSAVIGEEQLDTGFHVTTPDPMQIQELLRKMVDSGLSHCILEATSHGLAQRRVSACDFDIGVVTNITHEHLDYHGSYQNYLEAKALLFTDLGVSPVKDGGPEKAAILNRDDESYPHLQSVTNVKQISYGLEKGADLVADEVIVEPEGLSFTAFGRGYKASMRSSLIGLHNVYNCLAAIAASVDGLGVDPEIAARGIATLDLVPGRMELIELGQLFAAVVDFAHTPNALKRALETAQGLTKGRVIAVFGSAGERDREKRRMMAEVSAELADMTILTAEDPRSESLEDILAEMLAGAISRGAVEGSDVWRVPDRGEALRFAVRMARPGDIVISCGKGHEQSMCFGEIEYPWDDRTAMRAALAELLGVKGPAMPTLPTSV